MSRITITRSINAPVDFVFGTVAHISEFSKAVPHIVDVEYLSEKRSGAGTRFRETRLMNGKKMSTDLEVTEYEKDDHVRIVADSHGTVWDSLFTVRRDGEHTLLTMTMDARSSKVINNVINFFISGMVKKAVAGDMDSVKAYCEKR